MREELWLKVGWTDLLFLSHPKGMFHPTFCSKVNGYTKNTTLYVRSPIKTLLFKDTICYIPASKRTKMTSLYILLSYAHWTTTIPMIPRC